MLRDAIKANIWEQRLSHVNTSNNSKHSKSTKNGSNNLHLLDRRISTAITSAFFMNAAIQCSNQSVFKTVPLSSDDRNNKITTTSTAATTTSTTTTTVMDSVRMVHIHPTSAYATMTCPEHVLFQDLMHSSNSKLYMKQVVKADKKYLKQLQQNWKYVSPYTLCGRKALSPPTRASSSSSAAATATTTSFEQVLPLTADSNSAVGVKRPLFDADNDIIETTSQQQRILPGISDNITATALRNSSSQQQQQLQMVDLAKQRYLARKTSRKVS